jgi:hypothetical protein
VHIAGADRNAFRQVVQRDSNRQKQSRMINLASTAVSLWLSHCILAYGADSPVECSDYYLHHPPG